MSDTILIVRLIRNNIEQEYTKSVILYRYYASTISPFSNVVSKTFWTLLQLNRIDLNYYLFI